MLTDNSPIILAVDTDDLEMAKRWVYETSEYVGFFKLGLEFFLKFGANGVKAIKSETDRGIFLDLKLHDIPNTVAGAARQVAELDPYFLTVHATGGSAMIKAAANALPNSKITAVTILTSMDQNDIKSVGFQGESSSLVPQLAKLAVASGARAIVCSPMEITEVRQVVNREVTIITPGVRPLSNSANNKGNASDDQKRIMDPKSAIKAGADLLVIGRPITASNDVKSAAKIIFEEVNG